MKTLRVIILIFLASTQLNAQQEAQFTQYLDNMLYINPAYTGSHNVLGASLIHREQWIGFEGSPRTTAFSIHSPISVQSMGLGLSVINDNIGPLNQTMLFINASYTLEFENHKGKLAFGVNGGVNLVSISKEGLNPDNLNDPALLNSIRNNVLPNFGFGMYYYTPKFFVGISSPKLLEQNYDDIGEHNIEQRHYFGTIGAVLDLTTNWKLRPSMLFKMTNGAPLSWDMSLAAIYNNRFWVGATYRLSAALGAFVQFQITPQFKVGIAGDFGLTPLRNYNYGAYEIMLSYDFIFEKEGVISPRYF